MRRRWSAPSAALEKFVPAPVHAFGAIGQTPAPISAGRQIPITPRYGAAPSAATTLGGVPTEGDADPVVGAASFGRAEPGEPEKGANVFGLPPTLRDVPGLFAQAGGSPSDSIRPRPTYRMRMACKRSGVRIPIAPLVRDIIRKTGQRVQQQSTATVGARDAARLF